MKFKGILLTGIWKYKIGKKLWCDSSINTPCTDLLNGKQADNSPWNAIIRDFHLKFRWKYFFFFNFSIILKKNWFLFLRCKLFWFVWLKEANTSQRIHTPNTVLFHTYLHWLLSIHSNTKTVSKEIQKRLLCY